MSMKYLLLALLLLSAACSKQDPKVAEAKATAANRADNPIAVKTAAAVGRTVHRDDFTPDRPFLQPNEYKERQYPVWTLLKELDAAGQLTPLQKFLTAPTMPAEELYDIIADPYETRNLANSSDHQALLTELRGVLAKWIEESNDQGKQLEPPEIAAAAIGCVRFRIMRCT